MTKAKAKAKPASELDDPDPTRHGASDGWNVGKQKQKLGLCSLLPGQAERIHIEVDAIGVAA